MKHFYILVILTIFSGIAKNGAFSREMNEGKVDRVKGRILVVTFVSTKSHKLTWLPLAEQLGLLGHNVTILSPIPASRSMPNVKEILTIDTTKETFQADLIKKKEENKQEFPFSRTAWFVQTCKDTYDLPIVKEIMKEDFDLIITQPLLNECATGLIYRLKAPLILFTPVSVPNFMANNLGINFPTSFVPHTFLPFVPDKMGLYERLFNFAFEIYIQYKYVTEFLPPLQEVLYEKVGMDVPLSTDIWANASLILSNGHFAIHYHKPLPPDIIEVGGLNRKSIGIKPLPKDLEDFIRKGKQHGFILFSMGTLIKSDNMSEKKRQIFVNVFSKLKQQIIWKWDNETMEGLSENVKLSKWLPQEDVLGHKDIQLFITHCGGGGTEEAIYHGVPMIGLPIYADQPLNSKVAESHGILIELDWNFLTEESLLSSIQEMLNNLKYKENVKKLSKIYRDRPQDQMEKAVYWVEYVMRYKGATHLRSAGRKLNWFQYHSFDVIAIFLLFATGLLFFIYLIVRRSVKFCLECFSKKKCKKE